ncbi:MAG: PilZ domain-containing protein [Candidatus Omnitrophica bacterium]|nr:PilZ domain-containing protein [Candidatus Omnitrophota bacterium]
MGWEEKRKYQRAYIKFPVEYRSQNFWQYIDATDISAGGLFLVTNNVEPPGTKIEVMFELGEEKKFVHAEGVVAWNRKEPAQDSEGKINPAGMGIMFTKLTPMSAQDFIDQLVKTINIKEEKKNG